MRDKLISDRTKSILLQVAFKAAAENAATTDEAENLTKDYYGILVGLHDQLGLKPDEASAKPARARTPRTDKVTTAANGADAPEIALETGTFLDYREMKANGTIENPRFPDFKTVDKKKSFWLVDKDTGEASEFATENGLA